MDSTSQLNEIVSEMSDQRLLSVDSVPREKVLTWLRSGDLEVLGAAVHFILTKRHYLRIRPPLTFEDYHCPMIHYFDRCLREDPKGEWAWSRYEAGGSLVNWFRGLWDDSQVRRSALAEIKDWMKTLYGEADDELRECLVTATLEHLFERSDIAKFFEDWKGNPVMGCAYRQAMEWAEGLKKMKKRNTESRGE